MDSIFVILVDKSAMLVGFYVGVGLKKIMLNSLGEPPCQAVKDQDILFTVPSSFV